MLSCSTNLKVQKYHRGEDIKKAYIPYNLPTNRIDLVFTLRKTEIIPGPFAPYAKQYLEISPKVTQKEVHWDIESIKHHISGVPNPKEGYCVVGDIAEIKADNIYQLSQIAHILSNLPTISKSDNQRTVMPDFPERTLKKIIIEDSKSSYKLVQMDSIVKRVPVVNSVLRNKTESEIAKDAAKTLQKIRKRKFRLISGLNANLPSQGDIRFMVEKLEEKEQAYLELFMGKSKITTEQIKVSITPDDYRTYPLFNFSETKGKVESPNNRQVVLSLKPLNEKPQKTKSELSNPTLLPYKIPAEVMLEIALEDDVLYQTNVAISQFGNTQYIPVQLLTSKSITFDATTGEIKSIK